MKLKLDNCQSITHIHKLQLVRKEADRVKKELLKTQKKFQNFVSELDDGYNFDKMSIDEKIIELNIILAKSDELSDQLELLELFLYETQLQLMN